MNALHIFPRFDEIKPNEGITDKGNGGIGMFVDGVPAVSETSGVNVVQGDIAGFNIKHPGDSYVTPSVVINPPKLKAKAIVENG